MNLEEKSLFQKINMFKNSVSIQDLPEGYTGTLLYGYNSDRSTLHVYVKDGEIHSLTYDHKGDVINHRHGEELDVQFCYPSKRVYRQETQFFFAKLLKEFGSEFSITDSHAEEENCIKFGEFLERGLIA